MSGSGMLLANRYQLETRIGGGGMGEVWRATDQVLGRTVAVKLMRPELVAEAGFAERFRAEARTMATIRHRGVVAVHDYHGDDAGAFLVMEHVEGESLADLLHRVGRLHPARTMHLMAQAAEALQAAHDKGVVHRDIKPANLLVTADDTLVLTDFGIARSAANSALTAAGAIVGTPSYLAPEQVLGQPATARSDLYALGVVAHECLTGRRPFEGENPFETAMKRLRESPPTLAGAAPPRVAAVVERALAPEPEHRWVTAREFAGAARGAVSAGGGPVDPAGPTRANGPGSAGGPTAAMPGTGDGNAPGQPGQPPPTRQDYQPGRATPAAPRRPSQPPAHQEPSGPRQPPYPEPSGPRHPPYPERSGQRQPPGHPRGDRPAPGPSPTGPPPWAVRPPRPLAVILAALLLGVAAVSILTYSLASLAVLDSGTRAVADVVDADIPYRDALATGSLVLVAGFALVGLIYLLLAVQVFRGRPGARAWAFTFGLPLLGCCSPAWWYVRTGGWVETDPGSDFARALEARLPGWYEPVTGPVAAVGMVSLLLALLLLMLPSVGRFIRRPPPYPYPAHPG